MSQNKIHKGVNYSKKATTGITLKIKKLLNEDLCIDNSLQYWLSPRANQTMQTNR